MRRCLLKCSSAIFVFLCSTYTYASSVADINHTLYVYLKNMTNHEIHFENVIANKPGNYFTVNPSSISPGETGIITAEKLINNDIDGRILFLDSNENIIMVLILDQEQIHYGQPIFSANGAKYHSMLTGKTRNKSVGPRYLTYLKAEIQLLDKSTGYR